MSSKSNGLWAILFRWRQTRRHFAGLRNVCGSANSNDNGCNRRRDDVLPYDGVSDHLIALVHEPGP